MKKMLLAAAAFGATMTAGTALAQDRPGHGGPTTRDQVIAQVDARFAKADANGDGMISKEERKAAAQAMMGKRGDKAEKRGMKRKGGGDRMAKRIDTNGDGMISLEEQRAAALRQFDMVDTNRDGTIDQAERKAAREKMMAMRGKRGGPPAGEMGAPGDE